MDPPHHIDSTRYRFTLDPRHVNRVGDLAPGDTFVKVARIRPLLYASHTEHLTFRKIVQRASPGAHFAGAYNESLAVLDDRTEIQPGRFISGVADCVHVQSSRIGPWVEGVSCEGILDDGVALYTVPMYVASKDADAKVTLTSKNAHNIRAGDTLVFFDPISGYPVSTRKIVSLIGKQVTLDGPVGSISAGTDHTIHTTVYDTSRSSGHFVVRNSTFKNSRRFGMFIKGHHGLVENNTFEGLSSSALVVENAPDWPEGLNASRLLIRDNTIAECGYDRDYINRGQSAISLGTRKIGHQYSTWRGHHDIRILRNEVRDWQRKAIFVSATRGVWLWGNLVRNLASVSFLSSPNQGMVIDNVEGLTLGNNVVTDTRALDDVLHLSEVD